MNHDGNPELTEFESTNETNPVSLHEVKRNAAATSLFLDIRMAMKICILNPITLFICGFLADSSFIYDFVLMGQDNIEAATQESTAWTQHWLDSEQSFYWQVRVTCHCFQLGALSNRSFV